MSIPAIVTAGDQRAAKAVYGESKVYLELAGRPLVAHVVAALQRVPEIDAVWVVGDSRQLEEVFAADDLRAELVKPLHIVPQFRNLYENAWETYRRALPDAPPEGRDPEEADLDFEVLYLSADLPFATPQEISEFVRRGQAMDCDYVLGAVGPEALDAFLPVRPGDPGIRVAYFTMRDGRFRQSNLHLARPARLKNRHYIEEMYEYRHQREFGKVAGLAWRLWRSDFGGFKTLFFFLLMHLSGLVDRRGFPRLADWLRQWVSLARVEAAVSRILAGRFRLGLTEVGGCAIDIDHEHEYDVVRARYEEWSQAQAERAAALYGPIALPACAESGERSAPVVISHERRARPRGAAS